MEHVFSVDGWEGGGIIVSMNVRIGKQCFRRERRPGGDAKVEGDSGLNRSRRAFGVLTRRRSVNKQMQRKITCARGASTGTWCSPCAIGCFRVCETKGG